MTDSHAQYDGMPKEQLEKLYGQAIRNLNESQLQEIERNEASSPSDSPQIANAKALYRALAPYHTGGAARWVGDQLVARA